MENDTSVTINGTQAAFSSNVNKFTFMFAFILISLYFLILMFQTFFSTRAFRESSRYVLFAHMLLIDTIQLLVAVILAILKMLMLRLPVPVCSVLIFISVATYLSTPLNLAVMSLERYIAICFPLRHAEICCVERAWIAMMAIWITGSAPSIADNILLHVSVRKSFFSTNVLCTRDSVTVTSAQTIFLFVVRIFMLVLVAMTIMYTYVKIMLEAKKVNVDKTSTSKAQQQNQSRKKKRQRRREVSGFKELAVDNCTIIMDNSTSVVINRTQTALRTDGNNLIRFMFLVAFNFISLYFIILMFQAFFSTRAYRDSARYVLFAHMLLIDTIHLLMTVILALFLALFFTIPVPVCSLLIFMSFVTYLSTPLNLAVMSLERYIAICFPLRHAEICCVERAWIAMMAIWITGSAPSIADNILLHVLVRKSFFSTNVLCMYESIAVTSAQTIFMFVVRIFLLVLVAMTIMYTYVKIMLEARKCENGSSSFQPPDDIS
nr:PREDICTED: uncharacterized protein LOC106705986 [Latimeria chalumnae]|eukprot:XP_014351726.1 PREDICTED: uncharacterized protein LOC106705986 [Latimeria chalumnae]